MAQVICGRNLIHGESARLELNGRDLSGRALTHNSSVPFGFSLDRTKLSTACPGRRRYATNARSKKPREAVVAEGQAESRTGLLEPENTNGYAMESQAVVGNGSASLRSRGVEVDLVTQADWKENGWRSTKRTKLMCTIGPASSSFEQLEALAHGGMNVARLNMCHGKRDWHRDVIRNVHKLNAEKGYSVAIMMDMEGSEIPIGDLGGIPSAKAEEGEEWTFTVRKFEEPISTRTVTVNYEGFAEDIQQGDKLVVDGGMVRFDVVKKRGSDVLCRVIDPGLLLPRANLTFWRDDHFVRERKAMLPTISSKDWLDIDFGITEGVDFIALSFVKSADVIKHLKSYITARSPKGSIGVFAKIGSSDSLKHLEDIMRVSDGAMVARGDLGAQIPLVQVPSVQQEIVHLCRQLNKPVIVASLLLESMIEYFTPTRAKALRALPAFVLGLGVMLSLRPGHALANVAGEVFSPQGKGLLASAWAGLVAGCLHTLTGPDHLAALAPLCIGRSRIQSAAVGALWGCGHDAGQIIFGLIFLVLKDKLHIELIRTWASRVVGLTLITIGGVGIYESQEPVAVLAEEAGLQEGGREPQVRMKNDSKNATTFATGVVYGLQPDALLMILPALALPSRATGAAFLVMFLLGTVLAMGSYTLFISTCSHALQKRLPGITKNLSVGSSIIAIALGLGLLASELFGLNIF